MLKSTKILLVFCVVLMVCAVAFAPEGSPSIVPTVDALIYVTPYQVM